MKADLYQRITDEIVAAIEAGTAEFHMPWYNCASIGSPKNIVTGRPYRGINTLLLWAEARHRGFKSAKWATYRQWMQLGAQVRKGERATTVLLWKPVEKRMDLDEGNGQPDRQRMFARAFRVFNMAQVDSYEEVALQHPAIAPIERADAFFRAQSANIWEGSDSAFYDPHADMISMPSFDAFVSAEAYYSVLAHELTHWTGAKIRLDRDLSGRFGSDAYAMEELIAELGAAFTVSHLELASKPRTDHAPYIASWLRVLGNDPRAIFTAASRAQAAADYLIGAEQNKVGRHEFRSDGLLPALEQAV